MNQSNRLDELKLMNRLADKLLTHIKAKEQQKLKVGPLAASLWTNEKERFALDFIQAFMKEEGLL